VAVESAGEERAEDTSGPTCEQLRVRVRVRVE